MQAKELLFQNQRKEEEQIAKLAFYRLHAVSPSEARYFESAKNKSPSLALLSVSYHGGALRRVPKLLIKITTS